MPEVSIAQVITGIIAVLVVAALAYGINAYINRIRAGWITDKGYVAAHHYSYTTYVTSGKIRIPVQHTNYVPDNWYFIIHDDDEIARWDVSESTYHKYDVGDWFDVDNETGGKSSE